MRVFACRFQVKELLSPMRQQRRSQPSLPWWKLALLWWKLARRQLLCLTSHPLPPPSPKSCVHPSPHQPRTMPVLST